MELGSPYVQGSQAWTGRVPLAQEHTFVGDSESSLVKEGVNSPVFPESLLDYIQWGEAERSKVSRRRLRSGWIVDRTWSPRPVEV